ncbi:MAG TPA: chemotaxis protein CheX [Bryobacteraceae bacterium]|jgi:chemotaxis protein CheX
MIATDLPMTQDEIVALIHADTEKVFTTMLGIEAVPCPNATPVEPAGENGGVVALVGFAGQWVGSGSVHCSATLACIITGKFLMADYDHVNDEVLDAMGEVANMIIGNFKDDAADKLGPLGLSTPTVIHGKNFQTRNWGGQSWVTVPFDCEGELFEVKICLIPGHKAHDLFRPVSTTVGL